MADMSTRPTTEDLIEVIQKGGLDEIQQIREEDLKLSIESDIENLLLAVAEASHAESGPHQYTRAAQMRDRIQKYYDQIKGSDTLSDRGYTFHIETTTSYWKQDSPMDLANLGEMLSKMESDFAQHKDNAKRSKYSFKGGLKKIFKGSKSGQS